MTDEKGGGPERQAPEWFRRDLPRAAQRALAEAEERRRARKTENRAKELGGPKGEEPTRYGDWERGGRAVDF